MNTKNYQDFSINSNEILPKFSPNKILNKIAQSKVTGCLIVSYNSVTWRIYFHSGGLIYANHSLDSFGRLDRHLRRLSYHISTLTGSIRNEVKLKFENGSQTNDTFPPEYQAICWLIENKILEDAQSAKLVKSLNQEVFESFLLLTNANYDFIKKTELYPQLLRLKTNEFVIDCQNRIEAWQTLAPLIISPEQRPYFFSKNQSQSEGKISHQQIEKFSKLLRGFSFRQLAVLTNQDEIKIAQYIYKFVKSRIVILREPQAPFDKLPQIKINNKSSKKSLKSDSFMTLPSVDITKINKLVCVDDSPSILKEISRFLDKSHLEIKAIGESQKALLEIIRFKPDIILLDVGMPGIDGYKLCQLIRNHHLFKETPIVMVTGNRGLIDRAKARVAGASDYLTKPFTQSDLLNMVFRHLT